MGTHYMEGQQMCNNCGDVGYTIEVNDEGVEYMENCFDCFVAAHEADQAQKEAA
jgi:hypothetical protein